MFFENKKILVTGAAGFIGSNLIDELLKLGADVIGLDNLYNGRLVNLEKAQTYDNFQFHKGDIRDLNLLMDLFENIDIVYHEAAFTSVPKSVKQPQSCNDVNINGTLNVLNAALKKQVNKIIFASSSSVYGDIETLPKDEDMRRVPISPYGVSKLAAESYMQVYNHVYNLDTICLRYFNVFGPRQRDSPYSGVIAIWLGNIASDEPLVIFGDGKNSRDFTYIEDVVQANLLAAQKDIEGEIINIGAGSPINLTDLANLMLKIAEKEDLEIKYTDPRPGDIIHSYADISKSKELLDFEPKFDQEKGLEDYFKWFTDKHNIALS